MIDSFSGPHAFLSNFYPSPISLHGVDYPTGEHAFQAFKARDYEDLRRIAAAPSPREAKTLGRQVVMRPDWEAVKHSVMAKVITEKFRQHLELASLLLDTGDEQLVEGNLWHDQTWGDCRCARHADTPGKNALGHILMRVRELVPTGEINGR